MPEANEAPEGAQAQLAQMSDELANRTFVKMQQMYPSEFGHCLEACKSEMLQGQLQQAHEMIEHLQSQNTNRAQRRAPAKKATAKKRATATSEKDKA